MRDGMGVSSKRKLFSRFLLHLYARSSRLAKETEINRIRGKHNFVSLFLRVFWCACLGIVKIVARSGLSESEKANENNKQACNQTNKNKKKRKYEWERGRGLREETERSSAFPADLITATFCTFWVNWILSIEISICHFTRAGTFREPCTNENSLQFRSGICRKNAGDFSRTTLHYAFL